MALNLTIPPKAQAASERAMQAISRQPKRSAEEYILQARRMLGKETSESPKK
jgi:hypothetical protein